jgi:hypothetical protein|tara:strand:+ start:178 stop:567 length:390 start_codon:yes stop_codon:yes gene_type:complete
MILLTLALGLGCEDEDVQVQACNANADQDQDGLNDCDEADLGTDPTAADSDEDGYTDAEEVDCLSDPLNAEEACYDCGWKRSDPGTLVSDGAEIGDVVANAQMLDVCQDLVDLWDFHGEYHILYRTAAW